MTWNCLIASDGTEVFPPIVVYATPPFTVTFAINAVFSLSFKRLLADPVKIELTPLEK
jgi:hypothetical protein